MMRWWWFGPAVTKRELERELELMAEAGIGGVEIQPVYPLSPDDSARGLRNLPYLSPEFLEALAAAANKARLLGLRVDLTLGSGWPFGGAAIPERFAASRLRCQRVLPPPGAREIAVPEMKAGERLIGIFVRRPDASIIEISHVNGHTVTLPLAAEDGTAVLFFIAGRTGMLVKRAAVGAEGPVLDHYDRAALDHYLTVTGEPLLKALGDSPPYSVFCDSLEVYGSNWTGTLLEEFRKRRGYDLRPYLPALVSDTGPNPGGIRHDWALTLTELAESRFLAPLQDWAHEHGTRLRAQAYGIPPLALSSYMRVDLPEGEGSFWRRFTPSRWAASAAHLLGRPVVSSETWTWLHSPAFRATPLDVKAEADRHFLQGLNQLVGHGWPYSPQAAGEPGWRFYAAAALNEHNPWWMVMPELMLYCQRLSYLMRQGRQVNDVAVYLPTADARASFRLGDISLSDTFEKNFDATTVIPQILDAGFGFDFIDDVLLAESAKADAGTLVAGDGRYRVVVLPDVERIPLEAYRKLEAFARGGGILAAVNRVPSLAPGFRDADAQTAEIRAISERLFGGQKPPAQLVEGGGAGLAGALTGRLRPDVALSPPVPEIGFVHRSTGTADVYFLANTGNRKRRTLATFRVTGLEPEWWDPFTGQIEPAAVERRSDGVTVSLELEAYGSRVLVFSAKIPERARPSPGRREEIQDVSGGWTVAFEGTGRSAYFHALRSWTEDAETRFYSGRATYTRTISVQKRQLRPGTRLLLDFGEGTPVPEAPSIRKGMQAWLDSPVREAAVVYVNGERAGCVWRPPYSVDITAFARPGENFVKIIAGNLAINRLAGSPPPDYGPLVRIYGNRFEPQDMDDLQPLPAGLLGPVRLVATMAGGMGAAPRDSVAASGSVAVKPSTTVQVKDR